MYTEIGIPVVVPTVLFRADPSGRDNMQEAFGCGDGSPRSEGLGSLCWPIINNQQYPNMIDSSSHPARPARDGMGWRVSEAWRRNVDQTGCSGHDRCQRNPSICNPKYLHGVDDVGPCPGEESCESSYSCVRCPHVCSNPCPAVPGCNRLTTRCFDWPVPRREHCGIVSTGTDLRPPRADLNVMDNQPERCPTCRRLVVDMACGPLGYNY